MGEYLSSSLKYQNVDFALTDFAIFVKKWAYLRVRLYVLYSDKITKPIKMDMHIWSNGKKGVHIFVISLN